MFYQLYFVLKKLLWLLLEIEGLCITLSKYALWNFSSMIYFLL